MMDIGTGGTTNNQNRVTLKKESPCSSHSFFGKHRANAWKLTMVLPFATVSVLFFLLPFLFTIPISFTNWSIIGTPHFVGFKNYLRMWNDPAALQALANTFYYILLQVPSLVVLGFGLALLLNAKIPGRLLGRTVVIMPYVINVAVMGIIWRWIFDPNFGILNYYLGKMGIPPLWWLTDPKTAMLSIVIANLWWSAGFNTTVYLAGIQGVPKELFEAAKVDGANQWQLLRKILIPALRPVTLYVIIIDTITSFQIFGEPFVMTQGGPLGATATLTLKIYNVAFNDLKLGYASALSVVFLVILSALLIIQFRGFKGDAD